MPHPPHHPAGLLFVPQREVLRPPDERTAERMVRAAIDDGARAELRRLAEDVGSGPIGSDEEIVRALVSAMVSGRLVAVRVRRQRPVLDAPHSVMLSDLIEPEPVAPAATSRPTETTWISFEVVDDAGEAIDAEFSAQIGGRAEAGRTRGERLRWTELELGTRMSLELSEVVLPFETQEPLARPSDDPPSLNPEDPEDPAEDPAERPPAPAVLPAVSADEVSFELVDVSGAPLDAKLRVQVGGSALLDERKRGRVVVAAPPGSTVELTFGELHLGP